MTHARLPRRPCTLSGAAAGSFRSIAPHASGNTSRAAPENGKRRPLTPHDCIDMRLPTYGGLFAWEFEREGHELRLRVHWQAVVNHDAVRIGSVPDGRGLADVPGSPDSRPSRVRLPVRVPEDWRAPLPGFHFYYPSRQCLAHFRGRG